MTERDVRRQNRELGVQQSVHFKGKDKKTGKLCRLVPKSDTDPAGAPVVKRGPGRPRKYPLPVEQQSEQDTEMADAVRDDASEAEEVAASMAEEAEIFQAALDNYGADDDDYDAAGALGSLSFEVRDEVEVITEDPSPVPEADEEAVEELPLRPAGCSIDSVLSEKLKHFKHSLQCRPTWLQQFSKLLQTLDLKNLEGPPKVVVPSFPRSAAPQAVTDRMLHLNGVKVRANPGVESFLGELAFPATDNQRTWIAQCVNLLVESSRCFLTAPVGQGKTFTAMMAACVLMLRHDYDFAVVFCPNQLTAQWGEEAARYYPQACVQVCDVNHEANFHSSLSAAWDGRRAGKPTFLILPTHSLFKSSLAKGFQPIRELKIFLRTFKAVFLVDEFHQFLRKGHKPMAWEFSDLTHFPEGGELIGRQRHAVLGISGTPILKKEDAASFMPGTFGIEIPGVHSTTADESASAGKLFTCYEVPSFDCPTRKVAGSHLKKPASYVFYTDAPAQDPDEVAGPRAANTARTGNRLHPFEYPPSLHAIYAGYCLRTQGKSALVFCNSNLSLRTLRDELASSSDDILREDFLFLFGEMPMPERDAVLARFAQRGGIIWVTPSLCEVGMNDFVGKVHHVLVVGSLKFDVAGKEQMLGRVYRNGQTHTPLMVNFVCKDEYNLANQSIIDRKQGATSAGTGKSVDLQPSARPRRERPSVPLDDVMPLIEGLHALAEEGLVLNVASAGFHVDPDSVLKPPGRKDDLESYVERFKACVVKATQSAAEKWAEHQSQYISVFYSEDEDEEC